MGGIDDDEAFFEPAAEDRKVLHLLDEHAGGVDDEHAWRIGIVEIARDDRAERLGLAMSAASDEDSVLQHARERILKGTRVSSTGAGACLRDKRLTSRSSSP